MLVLLQTAQFGARVSPDSVSYLSAARSFASDRTFLRWDGAPFVHWPPLFPALLSLRASSLPDAAETARWLNALCFGATVALAGAWLHDVLRRRWLAVVGTALIACALPLLRMAGSVWSEPLFVLLCLLTLRLIDAARQPEAGAGAAVLAGVCAGLAALTRYAGVLLVLAGALALLLPLRALSRRRVAVTLAFLVLGAGPLALWLAHTAREGEPPGGERAGAEASVGELTETAGGTVTRWFLPPAGPAAARAAFVVVALAGVAWTAARAPQRGPGPGAGSLRPAFLLTLFAGIYVGGLTVAEVVTRLNPPDDRLLAPVAIPLAIVGLLAVDVALGDRRRAVTRVVTAGVCSLLLYHVLVAGYSMTTAGQMRFAAIEGPRWTESTVLAHLDAVVGDEAVYTNAGSAVRYHTGRIFDGIRELKSADDEALVETPATVVWFGRETDPAFVAIGRRYHLDPIVVAADGGIYRISAP